jgi:outer membrane lipoprotein-sorting protein
VEAAFKDEPEAHALYTRMVDTMRKATTLSWVSDYRWAAQGRTLGHATYKIWLKKPNYARMEAMPAGTNEPTGILVGDGDYFWIYWPREKPRYNWEQTGKYAEEYEKNRTTFYMKKRTPLGRHSIGHEAGYLGAGIAMPILDPSTFHGYTDSLQPYLDGVQKVGIERVGAENCDVVEVSFMKHQRSWRLWLSQRDHLPRKLTQVVRVSSELVFEESWSNVRLDAEIPGDRFVWSPPAGWKEWRAPEIEEGLLKPGTIAPDFDLASTDGSRIKLSNFRGQVVWLNKWRCG